MTALAAAVLASITAPPTSLGSGFFRAVFITTAVTFVCAVAGGDPYRDDDGPILKEDER